MTRIGCTSTTAAHCPSALSLLRGNSANVIIIDAEDSLFLATLRREHSPLLDRTIVLADSGHTSSANDHFARSPRSLRRPFTFDDLIEVISDMNLGLSRAI